MGKISLEGMEFFAYHGCYKEEQVIGTRFIVDLHVSLDTTIAEESDHLKDTLSYVLLYQAVKNEMEQKSHLLEHVAKRIMDSLKAGFPQIRTIELKISKVNPPIGGKVGHVCYTTSWNM
jgi:7,8-dihydroneopterin aldolase/epimerase/oxygenase